MRQSLWRTPLLQIMAIAMTAMLALILTHSVLNSRGESFFQDDMVRQGNAQMPSSASGTTTHSSEVTASSDKTKAGINSSEDYGEPAGLPLPSSMSVPAYEKLLFDFLNSRKYVALGWRKDKSVRDTGPFIDERYYGTHPAVRVYYSPGIIRWLLAGRTGVIPDGEMIVKEQYLPPAIRHQGKTEPELRKSLESWTIMVKDSKASHDGWYWGNPSADQCLVENHQHPFDHPLTGFGHYCLRCHASTKSPNAVSPREGNEFTFAALRNIEGFKGAPLVFRVDDSWRVSAAEAEDLTNENRLKKLLEDAHPKCAKLPEVEPVELVENKAFAKFFDSIKPVAAGEVQRMPPVTHDWVAQKTGNREFLTSNQCMSCHAGLTLPYGPIMFVPTTKEKSYRAPGHHVSPYGEWRWTPMGLAGRDPVFYAQIETELAIIRKENANDPQLLQEMSTLLVDTCLRCHGAMGKRQHDVDHPDQTFTLNHVFATADANEHIGHSRANYGALARDGISCMVCHRMQPREQPADDARPYLRYFLETSITGNFHAGQSDEIYGPFKDDEIAPYAMEHALAIKPKYSDFIRSSQMCGTCHTVSLPVVDKPFLKGEQPAELVAAEPISKFREFHHHVEQATYLEWLNSEFENEFNPQNVLAKTCQDCHMSRGLQDKENGIDIAQIQTRIAVIQDGTYPHAENLATDEELNVRFRTAGIRRHNFVGLNIFLLQLFRNFDEILGVRKADFMTGSTIDIDNALKNFVMMAENEVAKLDLETELKENNELVATVTVNNKVGHRFPSGVGFRRAFLELVATEQAGDSNNAPRIVWSSGRTNELGVLIGPDGSPLPSEFFQDYREDGKTHQHYQPHHQIITSQEQVQIYETLLWNMQHRFTTSFIHGCETVKDNRLLPRGWSRNGPAPEALNGKFLKATWPGPMAIQDPQYTNGSGTDQTVYQIRLSSDVDPAKITVRATLYYQAIPPYFLQSLFENAPDGEATQRLHYMLSHIDTKGTPIENWKLKITVAENKVRIRR